MNSLQGNSNIGDKTSGLAQTLPGGATMARQVLWLLVGTAVLFCLSYLRLFGYFWHHWTEEHGAFGFGYFVPPSVVYLLWCDKDEIRQAATERPSRWVWAGVVFAILMNLVAILAGVTVLQSLSFIMLIMAIPYAIWGLPKYRVIWPALLYSATMVPWPGQLMNRVLQDMQHISIVMASKGLGLLGLAPFVDGVMVYLPHFRFEVGAACAGLTILFPTVACTILTAMMVKGKLANKLLLVALSVPVSILINSGRIMLIGTIGNSGGDSLAQTLHDASGFFGVLVCVLLLGLVGAVIGCGKYHDKYTPKWAREEASDES